jgi:integrase
VNVHHDPSASTNWLWVILWVVPMREAVLDDPSNVAADSRVTLMAQPSNRLSAVEVRGFAQKGMYHDGGGLYLQVSAGGAKSWVYRFMLDGRAREMGLGPVHAIPLAEARKRAAECRRMRLDGIDPIEARSAQRVRKRLAAATAMTFEQCAEAYIAAHKAGWKNPKHAAQWPSTLATYVYPVFGILPVQAVDVGLVMKALEPIWLSKPETASRLRGRIESILDWATTRGYRQGENPARWRGHLENLLPKKSKLRRVQHHPALPYNDAADFLAELRVQEGVAARALEFLILTAARTGEVIGARWDEIDLEAKIWVVPAARMKAGREHRVPLSAAAATVLEQMKEIRESDFVFPGGKKGKPLSNMAMLAVLKRMGRGDLTAHGFRSSFRDWAAERTNFPHEVAEMALAHTVGDKVEVAYRRGDLFQKRRQVMEAWARFCAASGTGKVVTLRTRALEE